MTLAFLLPFPLFKAFLNSSWIRIFRGTVYSLKIYLVSKFLQSSNDCCWTVQRQDGGGCLFAFLLNLVVFCVLGGGGGTGKLNQRDEEVRSPSKRSFMLTTAMTLAGAMILTGAVASSSADAAIQKVEGTERGEQDAVTTGIREKSMLSTGKGNTIREAAKTNTQVRLIHVQYTNILLFKHAPNLHPWIFRAWAHTATTEFLRAWTYEATIGSFRPRTHTASIVLEASTHKLQQLDSWELEHRKQQLGLRAWNIFQQLDSSEFAMSCTC